MANTSKRPPANLAPADLAPLSPEERAKVESELKANSEAMVPSNRDTGPGRAIATRGAGAGLPDGEVFNVEAADIPGIVSDYILEKQITLQPGQGIEGLLLGDMTFQCPVYDAKGNLVHDQETGEVKMVTCWGPPVEVTDPTDNSKREVPTWRIQGKSGAICRVTSSAQLDRELPKYLNKRIIIIKGETTETKNNRRVRQWMIGLARNQG